MELDGPPYRQWNAFFQSLSRTPRQVHLKCTNYPTIGPWRQKWLRHSWRREREHFCHAKPYQREISLPCHTWLIPRLLSYSTEDRRIQTHTLHQHNHHHVNITIIYNHTWRGQNCLELCLDELTIFLFIYTNPLLINSKGHPGDVHARVRTDIRLLCLEHVLSIQPVQTAHLGLAQTNQHGPVAWNYFSTFILVSRYFQHAAAAHDKMSKDVCDPLIEKKCHIELFHFMYKYKKRAKLDRLSDLRRSESDYAHCFAEHVSKWSLML